MENRERFPVHHILPQKCQELSIFTTFESKKGLSNACYPPPVQIYFSLHFVGFSINEACILLRDDYIIYIALYIASKIAAQSEDKFISELGKPGMIEVDTTYLWQMPGGVDAKSLCASIPGSSTNNIHADTGSMPVSAFSFTGNTSLPRISA